MSVVLPLGEPAARSGRRSQAAHGETAMISEERYESYDLECDLVRKPGEGEGLVIEISYSGLRND